MPIFGGSNDMEAAIVALSGDGVILLECVDREFCRTLEERGYLEGGRVYPLEAAFQAARGRVAVEVAGGQRLAGWKAFLEIIQYSGIPLKVAIVYRLLRLRFPDVKIWTRDSTLLARRRSGKPIEVLVLEEGESIRIHALAEWSRAAVKDGHDPVVAIVDRNGQATFYEARAVRQIL